ncbi:hypothetical protein LUZ60_006934 [Juncus effusus]|nr:hypothetical protein LUZ60_006934 [Juncus effusus]
MSYHLIPLSMRNLMRVHVLKNRSVYDSDGHNYTYTFKEMQKLLVQKAVLSHDPRKRSDFTAMIVFGFPYKLAMWRPGDMDWVVVGTGPNHIEDVICFKDKFYAVAISGWVHEVIQVGSNLTIIDTPLRLPFYEYMGCWRYFVDFEGQLLLVRRVQYPMGAPTKKLDVAMLDLKEETWHFLDNIGGRALFVGNNLAVVGDPGKFSVCVKNGIYFSDMTPSLSWREWGHDFGVYDVIEGTVAPFCSTSNVFHPPDAALTWLTPNQ